MATFLSLPDPRRHRTRTKQYFGFRTGDVVRAVVPHGKHTGTHIGRLTIRSRPLFQLNAFNVHPKYLQILQKEDGYEYVKEGKAVETSS